MLSETVAGHGGASQMLRAGSCEVLQPASGKMKPLYAFVALSQLCAFSLF